MLGIEGAPRLRRAMHGPSCGARNPTTRSIIAPRGVLCAVLIGLAAFAAHAAEISITSVAQPRAGDLVVRMSYDGAGDLQAAALRLRLDGDHAFPAASTSSAPAAATPVSLLLCIDRSGSMGAAAMNAIQSAVRESLVARADVANLPLDVAIIAFATRSTPLLPLTRNAARLDAAVGQLTVERGREGKSRLFDAVAGGLAELRASDATLRHLIVVSDGDDEGSTISEPELVRRAAGSSIPVDAVGFGALAASSSGSLATLAGATNGSFQVAGTRDELAVTLGRMIRRALAPQQYDVTFHYPMSGNGVMAKAPSLVYTTADGTSLAIPLTSDVPAAADSVTHRDTPPGAAATVGEASGPSRSHGAIARITSAVAKVPALVRWALAALVLLLIVLAVLLRRRVESDLPAPLPASDPVWREPHEPGPTVAGNPPAPSQASASSARHVPPSPPDRHTVVSFRWPAPGDGNVVAVLVVDSGSNARTHIEITAPVVRIGAEPDNDIVLDADEFVSGHHAVLRAEANSLYLVDLGSSNGTQLNGARFRDSARALMPGDRLTLGRTTLEVTTFDSPRQRRPAFAEVR